MRLSALVVTKVLPDSAEIYDRSKINATSDTSDEGVANDSEEDSNKRTLRHNIDKVESFYIQDLFAMTETDPHRDGTENDGEDSSGLEDTDRRFLHTHSHEAGWKPPLRR